MAGAV
jgi:hypothetical protein